MTESHSEQPSIQHLWEEFYAKGQQLSLASWTRTSRKKRLVSLLLLSLLAGVWLGFPALQSRLPTVTVEYLYAKQASKFNESKVALLIENRANPILAPLMLHFMSVVPPDWRFRFMGSVASVELVSRSVAIRQHVAAGKLDLTHIPANMTVGSQEEVSRFLTNLWLYERLLAPAEWLLVYQTDSMLCANSRRTLNDYLDYDWVGAPWNPAGRFGGNGGLSLRRVSAIVAVLRNQERVDGSEPEDVWLTDRLGHLPNARLANGSVSVEFSGEMNAGPAEHVDLGLDSANATTLEAASQGKLIEGLDDWRDGFYEPMGYHTGGGGIWLHAPIWGTPELRKHIWDYCPEVKMTLHMDAAAYVPGNCGRHLKRSDTGHDHVQQQEQQEQQPPCGTELIDGIEYPVLPDNLVPW